jgi:hypothetical protein
MHTKEATKAAKNQRAIAPRNNTAPLFHRKSTGLSTDGMVHATRARDISVLMHSCADRRYDTGVQGRLTAERRGGSVRRRGGRDTAAPRCAGGDGLLARSRPCSRRRQDASGPGPAGKRAGCAREDFRTKTPVVTSPYGRLRSPGKRRSAALERTAQGASRQRRETEGDKGTGEGPVRSVREPM